MTLTLTLCSWAVLTLIFAVMCHFTIWARTGSGKPRFLSVLGVFLGSGLSFLALFVGSGTSPPCIPGVTAPAKKFAVYGFFPVPNVRIDIFYSDPAFGGSRVCYIPWSDKIVNALVEAQQKQIQLGIDIPGLANGNSDQDGGQPSTFPLHEDQEMEKPPSSIQAP